MITHSLQSDDAVTPNQSTDLFASGILAGGVVVDVLYELGDVGDRIACKGDVDHRDPKFANDEVSQLGYLVSVGENEDASVAQKDICARVSSTVDSVIWAELVSGISLLEPFPAEAVIHAHWSSPVVCQANLHRLALKTRLGNHGWDLPETRLNTIVVSSECKRGEVNEGVDVDMLPEDWSAVESTLLLSDDVCKRGRLDRNQFAGDAELVLVGSNEELSLWRGHDAERC